MNLWRGIPIFALAGIILIAGMRIPFPGIDIAAFSQQIASSGDAAARLSIFALGLMPIYTALTIGELGRLVFTRGDEEADRPGFFASFVVGLIAVGLAALQAGGIANALVTYGIASGDPQSFIATTIASCVGATAVALVLCHWVRLPGFRNGFWALWALLFLLGVCRETIGAFEATRTGAFSVIDWLIVLAQFAGSIAAVVVMAALWRSILKPQECEDDVEPRDILIWPSVLASAVIGYIFMPLAFVAPDIMSSLTGGVLQITLLVVASLLIPLFVMVYAKRAGMLMRQGAPVKAVLVIIAAIQIVLIISGGLLNLYLLLPVNLSAIALMAVTVSALGLGKEALSSYRRAPAGQAV